MTEPIERIENLFTYHAPDAAQMAKYEAIRQAAKAFAYVIMDNTPSCADQSTAIRKIREATFTANAAVALGGVC